MQYNSNLFVYSFFSTERKHQTYCSCQRFKTPFQNAWDKNRNGVEDLQISQRLKKWYRYLITLCSFSCCSKARTLLAGVRFADEFVRESRLIHLVGGTCCQRNHVPRDYSCKVGSETIVSSVHLQSPLGVICSVVWKSQPLFFVWQGRS